MAINIVPKEQLDAQLSKKSVVGPIPLLLFASLSNLYTRRAERLTELATDNPFADYLLFAASIAHAQQKVHHDHPLVVDLSDRLAQPSAPLSIQNYPRTNHWHTLLQGIIAELQPTANEQIAGVLDNLSKASYQELEAMAQALLQGELNKVSSDKAIFLWAALSLYWAQLAAQIPGKAHADYGEQRQFCPVCESAPVASVVHIGSTQGLRYLHCGLCETQWHMVRVKCSNCEESQDVDYWSLDTEHAAIKAESCDSCGSYLKVFYQEKQPYLEVVADDLATLMLDAKMEEQGFARSSFNPFLFVAE